MTTQALITRIKALRELAEKATAGPWSDIGGGEVVDCINKSIVQTAYRTDAKYIAATNPAAMIELYDAVLKVMEGR